MTFHRHPLDWYVKKLATGEPLTSLLYGDGELSVAGGYALGRDFTTYRERVTKSLAEEMRQSLAAPGDDILRGTDYHLINPDAYQGRDVATLRETCDRFAGVVRNYRGDWYDGTIWDAAVRDGELGPLLRVLHGRETVLVANRRLMDLPFLHSVRQVAVPDHNAYGDIDRIEAEAACGPLTYLVCMGLGAIPLIMRLRGRYPGAAFLDLGSVLDVFVGGAPERGWRRELYADPARHRDVVRKNLEGVCPCKST